ncbi:MAG: flagellar basal body rod protein FlgB [Lachnospiraceae bacterium]|nr:flagellar basal body rod protein FlgB [Lachnospiraceae bacterium]MBO5145821.1 flagellar basal body rod protein FlgB [Lachnospiraceae bacterium]
MLSSSNVFDYINVLGTSLDAAAARNDIINNNIANVNTPNYKRKDIRFETELKHAFTRSDQESVDARVKNLDLEALTPETYTDYAELSYRYDGNNVDINNENAILAKNQIKYNGLMDLLNKDFSALKSVMK